MLVQLERQEQVYNKETQYHYLNLLISDSELFTKTKSILKPDYFVPELQSTVQEIIDYTDKYNGIPNTSYLQSKTGIDLGDTSKLTNDQYEWFVDEYPQFALHMSVKNAVLESSKLLQNGDYFQVEDLIKESLNVGFKKDYGLDYAADPEERLINIKNRSGNLTTGFKGLDKVAGLANFGDLIIYCGSSGTGKSLFLQNLSLKYFHDHMHVLYITLELHPELCARRMDAMNLDVTTNALYDHITDFSKQIKDKAGKSKGSLRIHYMPSGTTTAEIKNFVKDYELEFGIKVDVLALDYLDLIDPVKKVNTGDTFSKDKYSSEELRNYGQETNTMILTCSQIGRSGVNAEDLDHSHIAGGISKINTADLVLGIIIDNARREQGVYELQVMKNRNGSGTGRKVRLSFHSKTMLIQDDKEFLENFDAYSKDNSTQLTSHDKVLNKMTNVLNSKSEGYEVLPETDEEALSTERKVITNGIPQEIRVGMGSETNDRLRGLLSDDF